MLSIRAPAKVNLILEVLGKYDATHHQIISLVQAVNLYDILNFELAEGISFSCSEPSLECDNLVVKAATLFREVTKCSLGAKIELCKCIPWGMGLGGGSSDAAATLLALNKLWSLGLPNSELVNLASELGSDVPFFIYGGTALVEGKGERVTPLPSLAPTQFILLLPSLAKIPNKTKQLYSKLNITHYTKGQFVQRALVSWLQERVLDTTLMFNVFEKVVFDVFPELEQYKKLLARAGAKNIHLAGSGPALFTLAQSEQETDEICSYLKEQGLEHYVAFPTKGSLDA